MDIKEFSRKGGLSRSAKKLKAVNANLEKARLARIKLSESAIDHIRRTPRNHDNAKRLAKIYFVSVSTIYNHMIEPSPA